MLFPPFLIHFFIRLPYLLIIIYYFVSEHLFALPKLLTHSGRFILIIMLSLLDLFLLNISRDMDGFLPPSSDKALLKIRCYSFLYEPFLYKTCCLYFLFHHFKNSYSWSESIQMSMQTDNIYLCALELRLDVFGYS